MAAAIVTIAVAVPFQLKSGRAIDLAFSTLNKTHEVSTRGKEDGMPQHKPAYIRD
jgi:hypothetical protein